MSRFLQAMKAGSAGSRCPVEKGLEDYRMQELLVETVLPHLGLASLAHLRASSRCLWSLLDSQLCHDVWSSAAKKALPHRQQSPVRPKHAAACMQPQELQHQQHESPDVSASKRQQQQELDLKAARAVTEQQLHVDCQLASSSDAEDQQLPAHGPSPVLDGQDSQQHNGESQPMDGVKTASWSSSLAIQQLLREQAALLRSLSDAPVVSCLPVTTYVCGHLWSPCGTWVAMQQHQPGGGSSLVIWNTGSGVVQEVNELPRGKFLKAAWLPASSWLLWVKTKDGSRQLTQQNVFCLNLATDERHELVEQPDQLWGHRGPKLHPIVTASGNMMAYVHGVCVVLRTLPKLEHQATLSSTIHGGPWIASMSFSPSASHIAVCWGGEGRVANADSLLSCVEVFATTTHACCFSMPLETNAQCSWSPASSLLYINTVPATYMLDLASFTCTRVQAEANFLEHSLAWTADGLNAMLLKSFLCSPPNVGFYGTCLAVTRDGTVTEVTVVALGPPVMVSKGGQPCLPLQNAPHAFQCRVARSALMGAKPELAGKLQADLTEPRQCSFISPCGSLEVKIADSPSEYSRHGGLVHFDLDFEALSVQEHDIVTGPIPRYVHPYWHPAPAASCIYAIPGSDHDLWLIHGQQHRVLQHWRGADLLKPLHSPGKAKNACKPIIWSPNGAKLLFVDDKGLVALDFCPAQCTEHQDPPA